MYNFSAKHLKKLGNFGNLAYKIYLYLYKLLGGGGRGGLRVEIGHHKIGSCVEIGQNRIRGGWGVKKTQKTSDIIYVRSLSALHYRNFCTPH